MRRSTFLAVALLGCFVLTACVVKRSPTERAMVAVMIENQETARKYHRGIGDAQMVIEMLVEGGISRFAVLFDASSMPEIMGPIRSLRPYFIDAVLPYAKTIVHAGGSPEAFDEAESIKNLTTINALQYAHKAFFRDDIAPAPHNLFAHAADLLSLLPDQKKTPWPPYKTGTLGTSGTGARTVDINFFSKSHNTEWTYDRWSKTYTRINGGIESALHPNNVVILEAPITDIGEYGRLTIPLEGRGRAYVFREGRMMRGHWEKTTRESVFHFTDTQGNVIPLARGTTWMTILATLERVSWK